MFDWLRDLSAIFNLYPWQEILIVVVFSSVVFAIGYVTGYTPEFCK